MYGTRTSESASAQGQETLKANGTGRCGAGNDPARVVGYSRERRATNAWRGPELGVLTAREPRGTDWDGARLTPGAAWCAGVLTGRWPSGTDSDDAPARAGASGTDGSPRVGPGSCPVGLSERQSAARGTCRDLVPAG